MKRIYLSIKTYDILHSNYIDGNNCAITRALDRAGHTYYRHEGTGIVNTKTGETIVDGRNQSFQELTNLVWEMYEAKEEKNYEAIKGFNFTISY